MDLELGVMLGILLMTIIYTFVAMMPESSIKGCAFEEDR